MVVFAGVALLLALAGVYGVMAYTVSQRIPELGVRIALGATPASIMRLILAHGAKLAAAGLALGLVLSVLSARMLEGLLFGVAPRDPVTLVMVAVAIAVAMLLATYIPGRRAVRVDPMTALRGVRRARETCSVLRATCDVRRAVHVRLRATCCSERVARARRTARARARRTCSARSTQHVARAYSALAASRA